MGATGPQDCPLVYLVMTDDELRAGVHAAAVRHREALIPDHGDSDQQPPSRSGHPYTTPVVAEPISDGFLIPLPYGVDVD